MIKSCVIGASGYTGAELVRLLSTHPQFELCSTYVSENSPDANRCISQLYPQLNGTLSSQLLPLTPGALEHLAKNMDAIFLATPHEASHGWMTQLSAGQAVVFDLSGAFRLQDTKVFSKYYGFDHQHNALLKQAVYGLAEWNSAALKHANIIAVPGCYPTASLLALKPLMQDELLDPGVRPVINAVSGVSGAGRKAALNNSFCEVSLQAYGVLAHRHQPEISAHLGAEVIFTPHLGNFKRGILATITTKLQSTIKQKHVDEAYRLAYQDKPLVRLLGSFPKLDDVVNSPYCDLHWKYDQVSGYLVISSAIDNLLKGAASQAVQCANLRFGYRSQAGLVAGVSV